MFNSLPTFLTNLLILNKRKNVPPSGKSYPSPRVRRKRTQRSRGGNPARVSSAAAIYQPKKKSRTSPSAAARGFLPVLWLHIERAFCTDIGESPKPQVTAYSLEVRKCCNCGRTLRGQHPQVDPSQHGATAHRVGNGVLTRAHALHYGIGVPMRKVPTILRELCGVSITQQPSRGWGGIPAVTHQNERRQAGVYRRHWLAHQWRVGFHDGLRHR